MLGAAPPQRSSAAVTNDGVDPITAIPFWRTEVPYYPLGRADGATGTTATGLAVGQMRAIPFRVARSVRLQSLAVILGSVAAVGGVARLGIYGSDSDNQPDQLLADGGEMQMGVVGGAAPSYRAKAVSLQLLPGRWYWAVILCGVTVVGLQVRNYPLAVNPIGLYQNVATGDDTPGAFVYVAQAYGPLPASFPRVGAANAAGGWPGFFGQFA